MLEVKREALDEPVLHLVMYWIGSSFSSRASLGILRISPSLRIPFIQVNPSDSV